MDAFIYSVGSAEWSSSFQVVSDIAGLSLSSKTEFMLFSLFTFNLAVDVLHIINAKRFTFLMVKVFGSLGRDLRESIIKVFLHGLMLLRVQHSQRFVIVFIDVELHWVLVVGKKRIVAIGQISKSATLNKGKSNGYEIKKRFTYKVERVLDWRFVVHWSEEVVLDRQYHNLLEKLVTHQELFTSSRNISITVFDSHTGKSSWLNLECDATGQWKSSLGFLRRVDSWVSSSGKNIKAFVTNLVYH